MTTTTHWPCPVDATPCWRGRECPHVVDCVRACVRDATDNLMDKHADTWAAMAKE